MSVKFAVLPSRAVLQEFESRYANGETRSINDLLPDYHVAWTERDWGYNRTVPIEYQKARILFPKYYSISCGKYLRAKIVQQISGYRAGELHHVHSLNRRNLLPADSYFKDPMNPPGGWSAESEAVVMAWMVGELAKNGGVSIFSSLQRIILLGVETLDEPVMKRVIGEKALALRKTRRERVEFHIGSTGLMLNIVYM